MDSANAPVQPAGSRKKSFELLDKMRMSAAARGEILLTTVVESKRSAVEFERPDGARWSTVALRVVAFLDGEVTADRFPALCAAQDSASVDTRS